MTLNQRRRQLTLGFLISCVLTACQSTSTPTPLQPGTPTLASANPTSTLPPPSTPTSLPVPTAPSTVPASVIELEGAEAPPGFSILKFANVYRPTAFAFDAQGQLYVTSTDNTIYLLKDLDQDGRADSKSVFAAGYYMPLGITVHPATGDVYVSHQGGITALSDTDGDGKADTNRVLVNDLPTDLHQNDNLEFGPDGWLYMGLGSTCDACAEYDPRSASILRFNIDTGESEIYATGLRNPYDLAFHPVTGELFATDNGRDDLGLDTPSEELNQIVQDGNYGFPNCWNEQDQPGCEGTIAAVAFFESHSSADGLDFYTGERFPEEFRGNAFVTIFGSWLKPNVPTGIKRVVLTPANGTYAGDVTWFVRFPEGVMPLPLLVGPDGAVYVGDYINDMIYRISYGVP
jgi:putative membrane-bound dehydrogenase-like protein